MNTPSQESLLQKLLELKKPEDVTSEASVHTETLGSEIDFAFKLFKRAPADYLRRTPIQDLVTIANTVRTFVATYINSKKSFSVEGLVQAIPPESANVSVIMTALGDRPFVVDSITEFLRAQNIKVKLLLHPILKLSSGAQVSLTYLEVDSLAELELGAVVRGIKSVLTDVISVTEDFRALTQAAKEVAAAVRSNLAEDALEAADFLDWLSDGGFVFLGYRRWHLEASNGTRHCEPKNLRPDLDLGLFRTKSHLDQSKQLDVTQDVCHIAGLSCPIYYSKVLFESPVHRKERMDLVTIKTALGEKTIIHSFLGMLTAKSIAQEASKIPVVRPKVEKLLNSGDYIPESHDFKRAVATLDNMPKSVLFQYSLEQLRSDIELILALHKRTETRISIHTDALSRFIFVMVVMPKEKFAGGVRQRIQHYLEAIFQASQNSAEYRLAVGDDPVLRIYFFIPNKLGSLASLDRERIETDITNLTLTWEDNLEEILQTKFQPSFASHLATFYGGSLPEQYKAVTAHSEAVSDIEKLEQLSDTNPLELSLRADPLSEHILELKIFKQGETLTLSNILPFLENAGFEILTETPTTVGSPEAPLATVYQLRLRSRFDSAISGALVSEILLPGLKQIFQGSAENDQLNSLLLFAAIDWKHIAVVRCFIRYLAQISSVPLNSIIKTITAYPEFARRLVEYFDQKFDPDLNQPNESRIARLTELSAEFKSALKTVRGLEDDRYLRALLSILECTIRTNYFLLVPDDLRIAVKIDCLALELLTPPKPMFEIFISSPEFEGVHLRGGFVARGGIRWSERQQDYRTEVFGLLQTQMYKNSIIVPVGAKGGFIVKQTNPTAASLRPQIAQAYRGYIRSLLEITDTLQGSTIVSPARVLRYDSGDAYLVVAADKGTATFSDIANSIATKEHNFWLGDAFASGGSHGYDHKKYGITARGAWEAACVHFRELGIDVQNQTFSAVGIGDMSGDVFGNGMLLSRKVKLVAAFNHKHIFIDPDPDPEISYNERLRLFNTPGSQWSDYGCQLLSTGGGVYERRQKEIELSPAAQHVLGTGEQLVSGDRLIQLILMAPVALLWNGGIGTYVKASSEENYDVGDRANDAVRVNASDLKARIVAEGGNLGFTQLARIEYARAGGRINTDAVDNSGGVALSDLEVNLKILLRDPVLNGTLALDERNNLLVDCASVVIEKVLERNYWQSKALSLGSKRSTKNIGDYQALLSMLVTEGIVDRQKQALPDDEEFKKRASHHQALTRPELAILIAGSKMSLYRSILESTIPDNPDLVRFLNGYFPEAIVSRFPEAVSTHPLRREIIATQIANVVVERMGATFVQRAADETGSSRSEIVAAFLVAESILDIPQKVAELKALDTHFTTQGQLRALLRIDATLDSMSRWFLDRSMLAPSIAQTVDLFKQPLETLLASIEDLAGSWEVERFQKRIQAFTNSGLPHEIARKIAALDFSSAFLDVVYVSLGRSIAIIDVARLYSHLATELKLGHLLAQSHNLSLNDHWEALAIRSIARDLRSNIAKLTAQVIDQTGDTSPSACSNYLSEHKETLERYKRYVESFETQSPSVPALLVISRQISALARTLPL